KAAADAEARFEGLALVFERQRQAAFEALQSALQGAASHQEKAAALAAYPKQFRRRVDGLADDTIRQYQALSQSLTLEVEAAQDTALKLAEAALQKRRYFEAEAHLEPWRTLPKTAALLREASAGADAEYQRALEEDEAHFRTLAATRARIARDIEERLEATTIKVWQQGPREDDIREVSALKALGQSLGGLVAEAFEDDLESRAKSYQWFSTALEAVKGETLTLALEADEAPRVALSANQAVVTVVGIESGKLKVKALSDQSESLLPLRNLGVAHWLELAKRNPRLGVAPLAMRIHQIENKEIHRAWQQRAFQEIGELPTIEALRGSQALIQRIRASTKVSRGRSEWIGTIERTIDLDDNLVQVRDFVMDATHGVTDYSALSRARTLAPESFRVARAIAKLDREGRIGEQESKALKPYLADAARRWNERVLWQWEQEKGKP
ncbi:MAG: hypothetical protein KDB07_10950, partial [Planctomycetes bacterium]|nr:hypothetical protein [Planctomycetota bacterium]